MEEVLVEQSVISNGEVTAKGVLFALKNIKSASDWEAPILLSILHSNKFFNIKTKLTAKTSLQSSSQVLSARKNLLLLDEVTGGSCWIFAGFKDKGVAVEGNGWHHWKEEQKLGGGAHQSQSDWSKTTGAMGL
ncbi:hypothetical protein PPACK8108_LOCUS2120 [Phakopsora pachyrhizi]|uniref:Uncharacterized protein n=1 Tax=Phakopsora pachyrhizi TaxID=170000 RepID=A0AAV0AL56_PHAPC|nr:hypothetical protein PPACK8108_LOCUS2120 [Phakopsora pachyrhizi]